jgi:hypothetical protein
MNGSDLVTVNNNGNRIVTYKNIITVCCNGKENVFGYVSLLSTSEVDHCISVGDDPLILKREENESGVLFFENKLGVFPFKIENDIFTKKQFITELKNKKYGLLRFIFTSGGFKSMSKVPKFQVLKNASKDYIHIIALLKDKQVFSFEFETRNKKNGKLKTYQNHILYRNNYFIVKKK